QVAHITDRGVVGPHGTLWPAIRSSDSISGREADTASRGRRNRYRRRQALKLKRGRVAGCSNPTATAYRPGVLQLGEVVTREGSPWIAGPAARLVARHKAP